MDSRQQGSPPSNVQLAKILEQAKAPVLIVSSSAGGGNHSVGLVILEQFANINSAVRHVGIEELVQARLVQSDFTRHRWICEHAPALLKFLYGVPVSYILKFTKELLHENKALSSLRDALLTLDVKTVIATNHRAAFWISSLKRRKQVSCKLWGVVTDYGLSPGWKYLFADQIDVLLGALPACKIPKPLRSQYHRVGLPVRTEYHQLQQRAGSKNHVLVSGGAWGLGALDSVSSKLRNVCPELTVHVACGANDALFQRLQERYADSDRVLVYQSLPSLSPIMEKCQAVVTRPGGVTISEAHAAGRMIFLLKGLPVIEAENAAYALRHFSALPFSGEAFQTWHKEKA